MTADFERFRGWMEPYNTQTTKYEVTNHALRWNMIIDIKKYIKRI
jgi:hypothetical protein